jgi:predicted DNA-binding protein YlxM (UPF0122 family)
MSIKKELTLEKLAELTNPPIRMSLSVVARKYRVTRQRIYQLYKEYKEENPGLFYEPPKMNPSEIQKFLNQNMTMTEIADYYEVTTGTLKKFMRKNNLKKCYIKDVLTKEILYHLYVELEKSDEEIAELFNCSPNTVMKFRYNEGVYKYLRKPLYEKLTKETFIWLYLEEKLCLFQLAELFRTNIQNILALKEDYGINDMVKEILRKENRLKYRSPGVSEERLEDIRQKLIEKGVLVDENHKVNINDYVDRSDSSLCSGM